VQIGIERAFIVHGPIVSSSQLYDWCFPHKRRVRRLHRYSVYVNVRRIADRVGRAGTRGKPWLWKLKADTSSATSD
jgi:hypothetical protein